MSEPVEDAGKEAEPTLDERAAGDSGRRQDGQRGYYRPFDGLLHTEETQCCRSCSCLLTGAARRDPGRRREGRHGSLT